MAGKKKEAVETIKSTDVIPTSIQQAVNAIAKGLGVAAVELWGIFVRQYVVRGLVEALSFVVLLVLGIFLWQFITWWAFIPIAGSLVFAYGALLSLGNPKYYAIEDITKKIKELTKDSFRNF